MHTGSQSWQRYTRSWRTSSVGMRTAPPDAGRRALSGADARWEVSSASWAQRGRVSDCLTGRGEGIGAEQRVEVEPWIRNNGSCGARLL